jgi:hypothetical protein
VEVNQGEIVGLWDQMALENNFILYDCGLVKPNSETSILMI